MILVSARRRLYLALAALALASLLAVSWVALAQAQSQDSDSEQMDGSGPDNDTAVPYDGPSGIWVSGKGSASGAPDLAVISLGVESVEETAAAARANAAAAMQDVMTVLTEAEVADSDIQTRHFNIRARYQGVEIERCEDSDSEEGNKEKSAGESCFTIWENRLTGYSVSNQVSVKVRDLDNAGAIIDKVTDAAGDLVRINGISFNLEDPQELQDQARANAIADLKRKAEMLAELSGVKLGRLVYLNEGAAYVPPQQLYARAESASDDSGVSTIISGGELQFTATLQAVFLIAGEVEAETDSDEVEAEADSDEPEAPTTETSGS